MADRGHETVVPRGVQLDRNRPAGKRQRPDDARVAAADGLGDHPWAAAEQAGIGRVEPAGLATRHRVAAHERDAGLGRGRVRAAFVDATSVTVAPGTARCRVRPEPPDQRRAGERRRREDHDLGSAHGVERVDGRASITPAASAPRGPSPDGVHATSSAPA